MPRAIFEMLSRAPLVVQIGCVVAIGAMAAVGVFTGLDRLVKGRRGGYTFLAGGVGIYFGFIFLAMPW